jgi:hypothetical protein
LELLEVNLGRVRRYRDGGDQLRRHVEAPMPENAVFAELEALGDDPNRQPVHERELDQVPLRVTTDLANPPCPSHRFFKPQTMSRCRAAASDFGRAVYHHGAQGHARGHKVLADRNKRQIAQPQPLAGQGVYGGPAVDSRWVCPAIAPAPIKW